MQNVKRCSGDIDTCGCFGLFKRNARTKFARTYCVLFNPMMVYCWGRTCPATRFSQSRRAHFIGSCSTDMHRRSPNAKTDKRPAKTEELQASSPEQLSCSFIVHRDITGKGVKRSGNPTRKFELNLFNTVAHWPSHSHCRVAVG